MALRSKRSRSDSPRDPARWQGLGIGVDADQIRRERERARELRASAWWKRRRSTGRCHYCGNAFPPASLTMDHVVPLVRGGRSARGNVVPACRACNAAKRARLVWEDD